MALASAGSNWTDAENDLLVADYFTMLGEELAGRPYVKSHHNAGIATATRRSKGSIEFKYRNVSAVLSKLGLPIIKGYLPAYNAQFGALSEAIERYLSRTPAALEPEVQSRNPFAGADPFVLPPVFDPSAAKTPGPIRLLARKFDPVARDARNRSLGKKGEAFVMEVEERHLFEAGRRDLIRDLRWVSDIDGDGAGYDILSFYPTSGARKLIEVKTTCGDAQTPFFVTRTEKSLADRSPSEFNLYRVFDFAASPRIFTLRPPLEDAVHLEAETWRAAFRPLTCD
ncbi:DUF3883 domain-containing protein [Rhodoblastus sp.]|jgi:hypothetical protein|uniref:DUF3883 domain-containing protein n=1 Tax=Rhodoblastus sp. TaxID=1962975 RepID=UPI0025E5C5BB|nr:DUF3883 domain-containing protein [Rhodoblastus sp.]